MVSSLTHWIFRKMFNFHIFLTFLYFFLLLISNFTPLWLDNVLCIISILLNLLRYILWPSIWSIMENDPCQLAKNIVCCWMECSIGIWCSWIIVLIKSSISLLIFYIVIHYWNWVIKVSNYYVDLFPLFESVFAFLTYFWLCC